MRASQRRQITRLAMAFVVGIVLGKFNAAAPGSSDPEDRGLAVARDDSASSPWQQNPPALTTGYSPGFSLLQPTSISLQISLGRPATGNGVANADTTGSIAAADIPREGSADLAIVNRLHKGDRDIIGVRAPQMPQIVESPSAVAVAVPRAAKPAVTAEPLSVAGPLDKDTHAAAPQVQLANATAPALEQADRSGIERKRAASLASPIIIGHTRDDNEGGDVEDFAEKYEKIRKSGRMVEIDGLCVSACTIVASLPKNQVCVTPRAALGVHLASDSDDRVDLHYTDWAVKKYYPKPMQDWIKTHGGLQEEPKFIRGNDLLAIFNACRNGA